MTSNVFISDIFYITLYEPFWMIQNSREHTSVWCHIRKMVPKGFLKALGFYWSWSRLATSRSVKKQWFYRVFRSIRKINEVHDETYRLWWVLCERREMTLTSIRKQIVSQWKSMTFHDRLDCDGTFGSRVFWSIQKGLPKTIWNMSSI